MKKLLFLSHRLPYPPHSGAAARSFNVLKQLSQHFDVTALCFDRIGLVPPGFTQADREKALSKYAKVSTFAIEQQGTPLRLIRDHLEAVARGVAYVEPMYRSRLFNGALSQAMKQDWDLVHVDSLDLVGYLEALPMDRTVLTHHNHESELLMRRAAQFGRSVKGRYVRYQGAQLRKAERTWVPRVALNVFVSDTDATAVLSATASARHLVAPNGVDTEFFPKIAQLGKGAVFMGGLHWAPNRSALEWYRNNVMPELQSIGAQINAKWIGNASEEERLHYQVADRLELTGYVNDVRPHLQQACMFIAPLQFGAGTKLKMLDAWASGLPIVATTIACEGLPAVHMENVLIADSPREFAAAMLRLSSDSQLARRLADTGRDIVERKYSWTSIGQSLAEAYAELAI